MISTVCVGAQLLRAAGAKNAAQTYKRSNLHTGLSRPARSPIVVSAGSHTNRKLRMSSLKASSSGPGTESFEKPPSPTVLNAWQAAEAVCFDVDSTLCKDESIDELASFLGHGEAVAALTSQAMGGALKFEDTLAARLGLMQPSKDAISRFLVDHPPQLSEGIADLIKALQARGKAVFLVSGGFRVIINPIAELLGIPLDHVFANNILHQADGSYAGFDEKELTSRSGGKLQAILQIKRSFGYKVMVMVGDGATDLEARREGGADIFIGYGGTVVRPVIAAKADWYIYDIGTLTEAL